MNINELSDEQKSVMLIKAAEIRGIIVISTLYDPDHMALAWRVLNWADGEMKLWDMFFPWWDEEFEATALSPADAQRAWLDKILELAIEAGLVEMERD